MNATTDDLSEGTDADAAAAVDNDVLHKAIRYDIVDVLWPPGEMVIGVLGAARYVLAGLIKRKHAGDVRDRLLGLLESTLASAVTLEPTDEEASLAAELEAFAQTRELPLDAGESQLAAITALRSLASLHTGDKRAIASLQKALAVIAGIFPLAGKVRCLEQLVLGALQAGASHDHVRSTVCSNRDVDTALTLCFGCHSGGNSVDEACAGLRSYIQAVRAEAPNLMAA